MLLRAVSDTQVTKHNGYVVKWTPSFVSNGAGVCGGLDRVLRSES